MNWAHKIRELRFVSQLKQKALAAELAVSQASVSQWERGDALPPPNVQQKLRKLFMRMPSERSFQAVLASVLRSPNVSAMLGRIDGEVTVVAQSRVSRETCYFIAPRDIGRPLHGLLGESVDRMVDQLDASGVFFGKVCTVINACEASRDGQTRIFLLTHTPFHIEADSWVLRTEARVLTGEEADRSRSLMTDPIIHEWDSDGLEADPREILLGPLDPDAMTTGQG